MKLKSIQGKIVVVAGLCLLVTASILVGYNVYSASNTKNLVSNRVTNLVEKSTLDGLKTTASSYANAISRRLEPGLIIAQTLAKTTAANKVYEQERKSQVDTRESFNRILHDVLAAHKDLNGIYSAWEPNAFDGQDAQNHTDSMGNNPQTGRFTPYWTRSSNGHIAVQPLVEYDSQEKHANGVAKGGWYIVPRETHQSAVTAPLPYIVQGKHVWLATLSAPILVNGKFLGVFGADYDLDFVQSLSKQVDDKLYGGQASVTIVTKQGLVIADSANPDAIGGSMRPLFNDQYDRVLATVQSGQDTVFNDPNQSNIQVFSPIKLGTTDALWSIIITVNRDLVMADVTQLGKQINQTNETARNWQIAIGLMVSIIAMAVLATMARNLALPIMRAVKMAQTISQGDFSGRLTYTSHDEIGQLASALDNMADSLQEQASVAEKISKGDLSFSVNLASEKDQLGKALSGMMTNLNRLVGQIKQRAEVIGSNADNVSDLSHDLASGATQSAAAVTEISATITQIAAQIKQSSNNADTASTLSQQSMDSADNGNQLMTELQQAMKDIESSGKDINNLIRTIESIAEQTNLLALNAAIEAARAGEQGRGFAVVADEVRQLAARSAGAVQQTSSLIDISAQRTQRGIVLSRQTAEALESIVHRVGESSSLVNEIASAASEQAQGAEQISQGINQIDEVTQQNSNNSERCAEAANRLSSESKQLTDLIQQFKLK
ncbi:methyl-accepting chemotaxis protein [Celerinatantimonas yamalensis]|uniref:Methyl-accepting chemotaxis protein n=1 Tax=Celerinatantimonas yamalensis TaxID=559956 RepID=A0ABW9G5W0_9GAMM